MLYFSLKKILCNTNVAKTSAYLLKEGTELMVSLPIRWTPWRDFSDRTAVAGILTITYVQTRLDYIKEEKKRNLIVIYKEEEMRV